MRKILSAKGRSLVDSNRALKFVVRDSEEKFWEGTEEIKIVSRKLIKHLRKTMSIPRGQVIPVNGLAVEVVFYVDN